MMIKSNSYAVDAINSTPKKGIGLGRVILSNYGKLL